MNNSTQRANWHSKIWSISVFVLVNDSDDFGGWELRRFRAQKGLRCWDVAVERLRRSEAVTLETQFSRVYQLSDPFPQLDGEPIVKSLGNLIIDIWYWWWTFCTNSRKVEGGAERKMEQTIKWKVWYNKASLFGGNYRLCSAPIFTIRWLLENHASFIGKKLQFHNENHL